MITPSESGLAARSVGFSYGRRKAVWDVCLTLRAGEMVGVVGPNGSGKSTLLRLLTGVQRPDRGSVLLDGVNLNQLPRRDVARRIAVVPQHVDPVLSFTVRQMVAMGRAPHSSLFAPMSWPADAPVAQALEATATVDLAPRRFSELSSGEQQRVVLAMALAQQTRFLLLDEPTVHLDVHHQHQFLELLRQLNRARQVTVLAVMHDLNLAALYFDRLVLMRAGAIAADGSPDEVMTSQALGETFRAPLHRIRHPTTGVTQLLLDPDSSDPDEHSTNGWVGHTS